MLSEKGALTQTSSIKLLLSVYEQSLTGILYLKQEEVLKVLYFNDGKLIWAISNSEDDKLKNILLDGTYLNEIELDKFRSDWDKDTFGKILVENGLITLEELIEATRFQLKQIIISVLRWNDGSFQFTKDSPPQKFLSLELNIVEFVSEYIFKSMDISVIWKEIGSLQIELKQNPDGSKFKMYKLSSNQQGLLNLFNGDMKLEGIISKYSGTQREIVLKTIYFFLISELLIKKGFDLESLDIKSHEKKNIIPDIKPEMKVEDKVDISIDEKNISEDNIIINENNISEDDIIIEEKHISEDEVIIEKEYKPEPENYSISDEMNNVDKTHIPNEENGIFNEFDEVKKKR